MFEGQILALLESIDKNQKEILSRVSKMGIALATGLGNLEMPKPSTKTERPRQSDDERREALEKAEAKRQRKAAKKSEQLKRSNQ